MKKYIFIIVAILFFFVLRYLFIVGVIGEEGVAGGLYEPLRVFKIEKSGSNIEAKIFKGAEYSFKKLGPITLLQSRAGVASTSVYFGSKLKIGEDLYPVTFYKYVGPLYIYIPGIFMGIFGKKIYSLRSLCLISLFLFILSYLKFMKKIHSDMNRCFLLTLFLITFPFFSMRFLTLSFWNDTVVFISAVLFFIKIKDVLEKPYIDSKDIFYFSFLGGLMLHFHLLAGGALFASILISFLSTKKVSIKKNSILLIGSFLIFILFLIPFIITISFQDIINFLSEGGDIDIKKIILMPFSPIFNLFVFIFLPSFSTNFSIQGRFEPIYIPFSGFPGILIFLSIIEMIRKRKENPFNRFSFMVISIYIIFSMVSTYLRPFHFNYIFILIVPFIFSHFEKIGMSNRLMNVIVIGGICFNMVQNEMLRNSIINSSLSLSIQKEVIKYLEKNDVKEVNDFVCRQGLEFLSNGKIKTLDFYPYLYPHHSYEKIALSLIYSKGKVIMVEKFKRPVFTTGISPEEIYSVAERIGLNVKILKQFPDEKNPVIILMKVE
jgi:hypothetical protein